MAFRRRRFGAKRRYSKKGYRPRRSSRRSRPVRKLKIGYRM